MTATQNTSLAYQNLHPGEILSAVESLGYRCDGRLLALNSYENRVYRVGREDSTPVVVKFYRPGRWSKDAILEEHKFTIELALRELSVVPPLVQDGETLFEYGAFRFAVYPCCGGRAPDLDDQTLQRQLGRFVARIHAYGEEQPFLHRPLLDLSSYGQRSHDFLLEGKFIPADLEPAYASLCEHLFEGIRACYGRAGQPRHIRLHGDFHPSNVLVLQDRLYIVDFDDCRMGPAVQDLWMFLSGHRAEQSPQLQELLEGYLQFRHFDARELHLIEALRTLRIMHYAAWLARRWQDPAFQLAFPWFNSQRYWGEHILMLREQAALMEQEPLPWHGY